MESLTHPAMTGSTPTQAPRLAELMAAMSIATDYGMGQPVDYAQATCVLGMRLGEAAGLSSAELRDVYYQALLRFIGCNAETYAMAAVVGDELALRAEFAAIDAGKPRQVIPLAMRFIRQANAGATPLELAAALLRGMAALGSLETETFPGHCEVAQRLAERLGFGPTLVRGLGQLYARWDGKGVPRGVQGEQITLPVRLVMLAQDAVTFHRLGGADQALEVARKRRGRQYDPRLVDVFLREGQSLLADLAHQPTWQRVLALEPGEPVTLEDAAFDSACMVLADFADIKSQYTLAHSQHVAAIAQRGAELAGLGAEDTALARRAALLHDIGRVGVSAGIWGKRGSLSEREWEKVRLHCYYTERILARFPALAKLGTVASFAHERIDGQGYFRTAQANAIAPAARLLAAADVFCAMTEERPHRPAHSADIASEMLRAEARAGKLDPQAVAAVLAAAGAGPIPARRRDPSLLTERELDVLNSLARGRSNKEIARDLGSAPKTVDNQVQSIYQKLGVRTRAGATLAAMERSLLCGWGA